MPFTLVAHRQIKPKKNVHLNIQRRLIFYATSSLT